MLLFIDEVGLEQDPVCFLAHAQLLGELGGPRPGGSVGSLGQTVDKPRVQPGKTVPREFLRAQPVGTSEGQFF